MAAEDKKISALTTWAYAEIQAAATIVVAHASDNYKIALSTLKQYVLGNKTIDGTGSGDIPTNGGTQTFVNKRLDAPSFNNYVTLDSAVTATQMNFLKDLDTNVNAKFENIDANVLGVENIVEGLLNTISALQADKIYSASHAAGGTSIVLGSTAIDSGNKIDPDSLSISVYEYSLGTSVALKLLNLSNIVISKSGDYLSNITIADTTHGNTYQIVIRYRVAA